MSPVSPAMQDLARRLVELEAGGETTASGVALRAEAIFRDIHDRLEPMVGSMGVQVLLQRAIHVARTESSLLEGIALGEGGTVAGGLAERFRGGDASEAREAVHTLLAAVFDHLALFAGDELTTRIMSLSWPQLVTDSSPPSQFEEAE